MRRTTAAPTSTDTTAGGSSTTAESSVRPSSWPSAAYGITFTRLTTAKKITAVPV